jgi:hypothetical protein
LSTNGRSIAASDHVRFHAHYLQDEQSKAGEEEGSGIGSSGMHSAAVRWQEGALFSLHAAWPVLCFA